MRPASVQSFYRRLMLDKDNDRFTAQQLMILDQECTRLPARHACMYDSRISIKRRL
jgi:hypothetical protein